MKPVKVGVVGLGNLGRHHLRVYSELQEAELVGGYDADQNVSAERCGGLGTPSFSRYEALLEQVEALSIVVPTVAHFEVAMKALERGIHILLEKPISRTIEEAQTLIETAREQKCTLQIGHIERFNRALRSVEGMITRPLFIEAQRMSPFSPRGTDVSVIQDLMIHDIDIILSLISSPIERIDAVGAAVVSEEEDMANARLLFRNGCVANITTSRMARERRRRMQIFQSDTCLSLDLLEGTADIFRLADSGTIPETGDVCHAFGQVELGSRTQQIVSAHPLAEQEESLKLELRSFLHALRSGQKPAVTGEDGLRALRLAHEIMSAARHHSARISMNISHQ